MIHVEQRQNSSRKDTSDFVYHLLSAVEVGKRRQSLNFNQSGANDDSDQLSVSEAGDIGDRALHSKRHSGNESGRPVFPFEENLVLPIQQHSFKESHSHLPTPSPSSPDAILHDKGQNQDCKKELPWFMTYISSRVHLAVLGILGVLTRYLLEKLFGPQVVGATSDNSYMYVDLPPNMIGSFLMGWFGVVFKGDISKFSPELAVGLTTGYLGSLTTFSGWNQKMLELSVNGQWVFSFLGFLLGLFLVAYSFIFGVETAKGVKWVFNKTNLNSKCGFELKNNIISESILIVLMITLLGLLWGVSIALLKRDFESDKSTSHLWLGCIVGPIGVWIRFYLAKFNGKGLGRKNIMKWMPFGTLIANVSASCIMATFATLKKSVKDEHFGIVATGIQFGLCGCLSTVSTFIAEFGAMRESVDPWKALVIVTDSTHNQIIRPNHSWKLKLTCVVRSQVIYDLGLQHRRSLIFSSACSTREFLHQCNSRKHISIIKPLERTPPSATPVPSSATPVLSSASAAGKLFFSSFEIDFLGTIFEWTFSMEPSVNEAFLLHLRIDFHGTILEVDFQTAPVIFMLIFPWSLYTDFQTARDALISKSLSSLWFC
ncbi:unnamed protein product [Lactuca saligna]|uniref:CrcB-like protein n=1 Tax=Lactuca saligna TaxID=75948 RepID=A0AA35YIX0_LACSI|nr:unnamed protein product [Lactuca saligna]